MLSLQAKLNAISPVPDASETRTSCEFDYSALALPVPLEFADTDSLQDVPIDVFDEDTEARDNVASQYSFNCSSHCDLVGSDNNRLSRIRRGTR